MSYEDRNALPHSYGNVFHQSSGGGLPNSSKREIVFPSLGNDGTRHHLSLILPHPPRMTL